MTDKLYEALIKEGLTPKQAAETISNYIARTGNDQVLTADAASNLSVPAPVPLPSITVPHVSDSRQRPFAKVRVLAHVLLNRAYRMDVKASAITVEDLFDKMGRVFKHFGKDIALPNGDGLAVDLSMLRHQRIEGLPEIRTVGPVWRTVGNEMKQVIYIQKRSEVLDRTAGYVLPAWVWYKFGG